MTRVCFLLARQLSLMHWDQDDPYAFGGEHVLFKTGSSHIIDGLVRGSGADVR